jgi:hypothetical protein
MPQYLLRSLQMLDPEHEERRAAARFSSKATRSRRSPASASGRRMPLESVLLTASADLLMQRQYRRRLGTRRG